MALLAKLDEEELLFCEGLHDSVCLSETLFSDVDNLSNFDLDKFAHVRLFQLAMLSYEYIIDDIPGLSPKENFKLLEGAGNLYNFGARRYGKTLITLILDILLSVIHLDGWETIFSSYDAVHIRSILERIIPTVESHPFYKMYNVHVKRSPTYLLRFNNGFTIHSVNQNMASKNPGGQFFGHHVKKIWMEEASFEIEAVHEKRVDATSEVGCIERLSGMTNFTKYSPSGKIFYDLSKRPWIVNLPQFCNPMWDEKEKKKAEKKYGGESSVGFRVFVKGEIVEEGVSVFDMERVRKNYLDDKTIKTFEVSKETFGIFQERIIVEKPANASVVYIVGDVGESAPTELAIFAKIKNKYRYIYNITLYNLTAKQQETIVKHIGHRVEANFIGLDCTDGTGRAIQRALAEDPAFKNNLVWVSFNEKIPVDFEKDEKDNVIMKNGKPTYKEEYVAEWSVQHLKELLYSERMEIPIDYKFDTQINSIISMQSGNRIVYKCVAEQDHLFQAFQVFSIVEWNSEFILNTPVQKKSFFKSGI